jgi:hypothetical protein
MKNAIILHGRNCTPDIKNELQKLDYEVFLPLLPENTSAD